MMEKSILEILKDEKLSKEFKNLETLDEVCDFVKSLNPEVQDSEILEYIKNLTNFISSVEGENIEKLTDEDLKNIAGGKMSDAINKITASALASLMMAAPASIGARGNVQSSLSSTTGGTSIVEKLKNNAKKIGIGAAALGGAIITGAVLKNAFSEQKTSDNLGSIGKQFGFIDNSNENQSNNQYYNELAKQFNPFKGSVGDQTVVGFFVEESSSSMPGNTIYACEPHMRSFVDNGSDESNGGIIKTLDSIKGFLNKDEKVRGGKITIRLLKAEGVLDHDRVLTIVDQGSSIVTDNIIGKSSTFTRGSGVEYDVIVCRKPFKSHIDKLKSKAIEQLSELSDDYSRQLITSIQLGAIIYPRDWPIEKLPVQLSKLDGFYPLPLIYPEIFPEEYNKIMEEKHI